MDKSDLELTLMDVVNLKGNVDTLIRKAQIREVNCSVIDKLSEASEKLAEVDDMLVRIKDGEEDV